MTAKISLLVADDHTFTRKGIVQMMQDLYPLGEVYESGDGVESLALALEKLPDLIFLDITIPFLNGIHVCQQILSKNPEAKVIIITMNEPREYLVPSLEAGAMGFLRKDATAAEFKEAVDLVLSGKKYLTPASSSELISAFLALKKHPVPSKTDVLTLREKEILTRIAEGHSTREISEAMTLSYKTIETHRSNLMRKLRLHTLNELVRFAIQNKFISGPKGT